MKHGGKPNQMHPLKHEFKPASLKSVFDPCSIGGSLICDV
jgi:hypothetical protein